LVVCNSEFTARTASTLFPGIRAEVIYCPVTMADESSLDARAARAEVRAELATDERAVVIIQVSRMEELKGHGAHLEALALMKDVPDWTCWMVGGAQRPLEAAYLESLKSQAARLGIADRVRFTGERTDVPRLLAAADVFCQPNSSPEAFGLVFTEAMLARLPVVTTAIGGATEIVNDSCGVLVHLKGAHALADALRSLLGESRLRARLGACGPARVRQLCSPAKQIGRLREVLVQV
ncbi:MAG: glycosyltransferase family 4 protein, partial [Pyrinomonadaceae bacterium]